MLYCPPKPRVAALTAAVQQVVPAQRFLDDPKAAARESLLQWIASARTLGIDLQVAAALAPSDSYVPEEAMLDPVGYHVPQRTKRDGTGEDLSDEDAAAIIEACGQDVKICDLGFFENFLHDDDVIRGQIHEHFRRTCRAAVKLKSVGCDGVTVFIGANILVDLDQNLDLFIKWFIPLLQYAKSLGLKVYIENCPMPGWNTTDYYFNNLAWCAGNWIILYRLAEKHGVADVLRITHDPSHDILMGSTPFASFAAMHAAGLGFVIARCHVKDQNRDAAKVALWTIMGQRVRLGCRENGKPAKNPADQGKAWGRMTAGHSMPGIRHYDPLAQLQGQCVDWHSYFYHAYLLLGVDPNEFVTILEHEWIPARVQDLDLIVEMLAISAAYVRGLMIAAHAQFSAIAWCKQRSLPLPGQESPLFTIAGLSAEVAQVNA
ncbi:MAG: TIM barrel protein [Bdellovibrionota bacterium]